ncbi:hypothetical protein PRO82_001199 [Candidatus Protochlamydia amoebophila]|nr:hypothetical protein [Candidatus Protochlamydia amoebophila]
MIVNRTRQKSSVRAMGMENATTIAFLKNQRQEFIPE